MAQFQLVTNGNMSANITSPAIDARFSLGVLIQANSSTTGTLGGTLYIQGSADHIQDFNGNVIQAGNWSDLLGQAQVLALTNASGVNAFDVIQTSGGWLRLIYIAKAGDTGTLNVWVTVKGGGY